MQEAELAVTLLFELGEGAPEDAFKPGSGTLGQLALGATPPLPLLALYSKLCQFPGEREALCWILTCMQGRRLWWHF